jgi:glycosyltransferase involved in cell wall biosynthesis
MLWQILILSIDDRAPLLSRLAQRLEHQLAEFPDVEALTFIDNGERSIGRKRQDALEQATADFVCFIDDDDLVSPEYVQLLRNELVSQPQPDVVGFKLAYYENDDRAGTAIHSYRANQMPLTLPHKSARRFNRLPNHLNPCRLSYALKAGFPTQGLTAISGEDAAYAKALAKLSPTEAFVDAEVYEYWYRRYKRNEVTYEARLEGRFD